MGEIGFSLVKPWSTKPLIFNRPYQNLVNCMQQNCNLLIHRCKLEFKKLFQQSFVNKARILWENSNLKRRNIKEFLKNKTKTKQVDNKSDNLQSKDWITSSRSKSFKWNKVFKNWPSKICWRQPYPQILLGSFLNTLSKIFLKSF